MRLQQSSTNRTFRHGPSVTDAATDMVGFEEHKPIMNANPSRPTAKRSPKSVEQYLQWVAFYVGDDGKTHLRHSSAANMGEDMFEVFSRVSDLHTHQTMRRHVTAIRKQNPAMCYGDKSMDDSLAAQPELATSMTSARARPLKRHRANTALVKTTSTKRNRSTGSVRDMTPPGETMLAITISNREAMEEWFFDAFRAVQQVGCRLIAKNWIKKIHPKKQSTHPYNGNFPRNQPRCPDRTRPSYWPKHLKHKEPDHIDKSVRTALLVHLIMNTPQRVMDSPDEVTAQDLLDSLEDKKGDLKDPRRWVIIKEICDARTRMEQYHEGGLSAGFQVYVTNYSECSRALKVKRLAGGVGTGDDDSDDDSDFDEDGDEDATLVRTKAEDSPQDRVLTPGSDAAMHSSAALCDAASSHNGLACGTTLDASQSHIESIQTSLANTGIHHNAYDMSMLGPGNEESIRSQERDAPAFYQSIHGIPYDSHPEAALSDVGQLHQQGSVPSEPWHPGPSMFVPTSYLSNVPMQSPHPLNEHQMDFHGLCNMPSQPAVHYTHGIPDSHDPGFYAAAYQPMTLHDLPFRTHPAQAPSVSSTDEHDIGMGQMLDYPKHVYRL